MLDANQLEAKIIACNEVYYNTGNSTISDLEYDALKAKLKELNPNSVVFQTVGAPIQVSAITQFKHINPMLSLDNVFNPDDLHKFFMNAGLPPDTAIDMEDKLDGLACSLHYKNGVLEVATTRGNGLIGEIITPQIQFFDSVPKNIPIDVFGDCEIRGEIVMPIQAFDRYNETATASGGKTFISARNAAVGSINSKDPRTASDRGCVFIAYTFIGNGSVSHYIDMDNLRMVGFFANYTHRLPLYDIHNHVRGAITRLENRREYGIDGIVFKVDDVSIQRKLGMNNTSPRWAVAFKQNIELAETIVEGVDWQVGRMGAITPVARLTPVLLSDAMISNVTLHNWNQIQTLGLGLGDRILIVRSGGVIPKVNLVLDKAKPAVDIPKPTNCPICASIVQDNEGMLSCTNVNGCKGIRVERLVFACSKEAMDIKGIGPEVVRHAFETGQISTIADLFTMKAATAFASRFPATADQNLPKYQELIKQACKVSRESAIIALCINSISTVSARTLAANIDRLPDLLNLTKEELIAMGMTPVRIGNFLEYIRVKENIRLIEDLDLVLEFEPRAAKANKLNSRTYVVTGSFEAFSRKQLEQAIVNNGGKVVGKISAKTDYLICGENAGSKFQEATKLNVPIMHEDEVLKFFKALDITIL